MILKLPDIMIPKMPDILFLIHLLKSNVKDVGILDILIPNDSGHDSGHDSNNAA